MIHIDRAYLRVVCGVNSFDFLINYSILNDNTNDTIKPELNDIESFLFQYISQKDTDDLNAVLLEIDLAFEYLCYTKVTTKEALDDYIRYAIQKVSEVSTNPPNHYNTRDIFQVAYVINGGSQEMSDEGMKLIINWSKKQLISDLLSDGKYSKIAENFNNYDELIWNSLKSLLSKHYLFALYPVDQEGWFCIPDLMLLVNHNTLDRTSVTKLYARIHKDIDDHFVPKSRVAKLHDKHKGNFFDVMEIAPISGGISLTEDCQLRCQYCSFSSGEYNCHTLSLDSVKGYVDWLIKNTAIDNLVTGNKPILSIIIAGGGEPTFKWKLFEDTVKYIREETRKNNIECLLEITTNGCHSDKQTEYIISNFDRITVSFDGLEEIQNCNRHFKDGSPSYEIVSKTLRMLDENSANYSIITVVQPENISRIKDIANSVFSKYPNLRNLSIRPVMPVGRALKQGGISLSTDYPFANEYFQAEQTLGYPLKMSCGLFNFRKSDIYCGTLYGLHPWLVPNGDIVTCQDAKNDAVVIRKVIDGVVKTIPAVDKYAEKAFSNLDNCMYCEMYHFCHGGCPLRNNGGEQEIYQIWLCTQMKIYWKLLIHKLLQNGDFGKWYLKKIRINDFPDVNIYKIMND